MTDAGTDAAPGSPAAAPPSGRPVGSSSRPRSATSSSTESAVGLFGIAAVALVAGAGLSAAAYVGNVALLVAVAVVQALVVVGWVYGTDLPGRRGALVVGLLAAASADVVVTRYPDARLGVLAAVLGLAVPAMFVHQLVRGAARVHLVSSLSAGSVLVLAVVAVAALIQVRHEFTVGGPVRTATIGGEVAAVVVGAAMATVLTGALMDTVVSTPRFDPEVPRGVLGLLAGIGVAAAVSQLVLHDVNAFAGGRAAFLGAAIGALTGLLSVGASFVRHTTPQADTPLARIGRPLYTALLPLCLLAPAAFGLCTAIKA